MPFAPGNIIRSIVEQTYDGQTCLNVFYHAIQDPFTTSITPAQYGEMLWGWYQAQWRGIVSSNVSFERVIVENLDGGLDYGEYTIPDAEDNGTIAGESLAAFDAFAIQLNRTSRLVRQGAKRIVGVPESSVGNFGVLTSGALDGLQDLADLFAQDLNIGLVTICHPVIVGFPNADRPTRVAVDIDTATAKTVITTQSTRKRGHGA